MVREWDELTDQEKLLLMEINIDATVWRGLPCGILLAGGYDYLLRTRHRQYSMQRFGLVRPQTFGFKLGRFFLGFVNYNVGMFIGRVSYFWKAKERIINELPEDSKLRQELIRMEEERKKGR